MSSSEFLGGAGQFAGGATGAGQEQRGPRYDLRPLSTGEVLDRTFQLYRSHFLLFVGLALLPAAVSTVTNAAKLVLVRYPGTAHSGAPAWALMLAGVLSIIGGLLALVVYGITEAATIWAMSAVYLGEPASIKSAYKVAFKHWFRYTLVKLRQIWTAMWLPMVLFIAAFSVAGVVARHRGIGSSTLVIALFVLAFISLIYGLWAYLRVSMAVPAAVVESLKVGAAMRRSKQLLVSRKFRILLLFLLMAALYIVVGMVESPLLILAVRSRGAQAFATRAIQLGVNFVAGTLIAPVGAIGVCLFYFDERVRREGFDIEWMMGKLAPAEAAATDLPGPATEPPAEPA